MTRNKWFARPLALACVCAMLGIVAGGCAGSSSGTTAATAPQDSAAVNETQPFEYTPAPPPATTQAQSADGDGAEDTTCEQFSTMDANEQAAVVQQMLEEMHQTGWGVDTVLPNVRAMCGMYPPNTPISVTMTG